MVQIDNIELNLKTKSQIQNRLSEI